MQKQQWHQQTERNLYIHRSATHARYKEQTDHKIGQSHQSSLPSKQPPVMDDVLGIQILRVIKNELTEGVADLLSVTKNAIVGTFNA